MPKPAKQTSYSLALNEMTVDGTATVDEMARAAGCSVSHMRKVVSTCNPKQLGPRKMIRLSHWLRTEKNESRHLKPVDDEDLTLPGLLGENGEVHPAPDVFENSDDIREEVMDARQDLALAIEALEGGDRTGAAKQTRDAIQDLFEALQDIQTSA